jgi:formylglycine-generating enzyme required for sulfatase activity
MTVTTILNKDLPCAALERAAFRELTIPPGVFMMGAADNDLAAYDDERPEHQVTLTRGFLLMGTPVTQALYEAVTGNNPSKFKGTYHPVECVSWFEAVAFCNELSMTQGLAPAYSIQGKDVQWNQGANGYRLPTEAEWEYAARGTDGRIYPWGNELPTEQHACWNRWSGNKGTCPVGRYPQGASPFGALDMAGNVWEWCWDSHEEVVFLASNPTEPVKILFRGCRGGGWFNDHPGYLRMTASAHVLPGGRSCCGSTGFRCARWLP